MRDEKGWRRRRGSHLRHGNRVAVKQKFSTDLVWRKCRRIHVVNRWIFLRSVNCMQLCCCLIYKFIDIYIDGHDVHDTFAILWVQLGIMPLRAVNG